MDTLVYRQPRLNPAGRTPPILPSTKPINTQHRCWLESWRRVWCRSGVAPDSRYGYTTLSTVTESGRPLRASIRSRPPAGNGLRTGLQPAQRGTRLDAVKGDRTMFDRSPSKRTRHSRECNRSLPGVNTIRGGCFETPYIKNAPVVSLAYRAGAESHQQRQGIANKCRHRHRHRPPRQSVYSSVLLLTFFNHSIIQPIDRLVDRLVDQFIYQLIGQSTNMPTNRTTNRYINRPMNQPNKSAT